MFYADSDNYPVENLYFSDRGELVGVNTEKKFLVIWRSSKEVVIHSFPSEIIKKVLKVSDRRVCLMLEATISREVEEEYQVEKHNKMELYDF